MSTEITVGFVQQYTSGITHLAQQKKSRFRKRVRVESGVVGKAAYYDQLAASDASDITTRHGDTPIVNAPHRRRQVTMLGRDWGDLVDDEDKVRSLNDPTNVYAASAGMALGRKIDDVVVAAATAAANTGEAGGSSSALPSTQVIVNASTGMTMAKLRTAKRILDANEVDDEDRFIAVSAKQLEDMLAITQPTSGDYVKVLALIEGTLTRFMGFNWMFSERLTSASSARQCLAWQKNSLLLAFGKDITGRITERSDKRYSMQVYYKMHVGATRMDETGVVRIDCLEA